MDGGKKQDEGKEGVRVMTVKNRFWFFISTAFMVAGILSSVGAAPPVAASTNSPVFASDGSTLLTVAKFISTATPSLLLAIGVCVMSYVSYKLFRLLMSERDQREKILTTIVSDNTMASHRVVEAVNAAGVRDSEIVKAIATCQQIQNSRKD